MRDWFYADKRDIVKWGAILVVARKHGIHTVLQVALYRPDQLDYQLSINGTADGRLPHEIIRHFRDLDQIHRLEVNVGLRIDVHKEPFEWRPEFPTRDDFRRAYFNEVVKKISEYHEAIIVFLDPDTGIAPANCGYEHVTPQEIRTVLGAMRPDALLMFYQHKWMGDNKWPNSAREKFCEAVGQNVSVRVIGCNEIANDVVFFVVERSEWCESPPSNSSVKFPNEKKKPIVRNGEDVIINTEKLTAREVTGRRVLCPACHKKEFKTWPLGWDSHAAFKCPSVSGDSEGQKKGYFKARFAHLFQS